MRGVDCDRIVSLSQTLSNNPNAADGRKLLVLSQGCLPPLVGNDYYYYYDYEAVGGVKRVCVFVRETVP